MTTSRSRTSSTCRGSSLEAPGHRHRGVPARVAVDRRAEGASRRAARPRRPTAERRADEREGQGDPLRQGAVRAAVAPRWRRWRLRIRGSGSASRRRRWRCSPARRPACTRRRRSPACWRSPASLKLSMKPSSRVCAGGSMAHTARTPAEPAPERRQLAVSREVLPARSERRDAPRVVVAPEDGAALLVEAATEHHAERLARGTSPARARRCPSRWPRCRGSARTERRTAALRDRRYQRDARGQASRARSVGIVLLRLDALAEDDAAVRIALEAVDELRGVRELRLDDRRPRLPPARLVACRCRCRASCARRPVKQPVGVLERGPLDGQDGVVLCTRSHTSSKLSRVGELELACCAGRRRCARSRASSSTGSRARCRTRSRRSASGVALQGDLAARRGCVNRARWRC